MTTYSHSRTAWTNHSRHRSSYQSNLKKRTCPEPRCHADCMRIARKRSMPVKLTRLVIRVFYMGSRLLHLSDASWSRSSRWLHLRYWLHLWQRFRLRTQNAGFSKFSLMSSSPLRQIKPKLLFGATGKHPFGCPEKLNLIVHHQHVFTRKF